MSPYNTATDHAFVRIDREPRDLRATGEVMEYAATIRDFEIEEWRIRRQRFFFKDVECRSSDDFVFQRLGERLLVHDRAA
jgi:hypothetical protein